MLDGFRNESNSDSQEQVGFFLEKVVPGLKKLGNVQISEEYYRAPCEDTA